MLLNGNGFICRNNDIITFFAIMSNFQIFELLWAWIRNKNLLIEIEIVKYNILYKTKAKIRSIKDILQIYVIVESLLILVGLLLNFQIFARG